MRVSHIEGGGVARMVDISEKDDTMRRAVAKGSVTMGPETLASIREQRIVKGDVLTVAQVAGISAAKRTSELVPLCHPLLLNHVGLDFEIDEGRNTIEIRCAVLCSGKTGVEMEALTGVCAAALTIYDMCKSIDRKMIISNIRLVEKSGGKSGDFRVRED